MAQDMSFLDDYLVRPDPAAPRLGATVTGIDQTGARSRDPRRRPSAP